MAHTSPSSIPPKTQHAWPADAENEGQPVPAWVKRWSSKLPDKLRTFVSDAAEIGKDAAASPAPAAHVSPEKAYVPPRRAPSQSPEKAYVPPRRAPSDSYGLHPSAGAGCSRDELEAERERRLEAERESRRLQSEVWSLKAEVSRLHEMMKRFDASNLESPSEAEAAVDMFLRLAREAHSVGEKMRTAEFEARRGGRYGLPTASPVAPADGPTPPSSPSKAAARYAAAAAAAAAAYAPASASSAADEGAHHGAPNSSSSAEDEIEIEDEIEEISTETLAKASGAPPEGTPAGMATAEGTPAAEGEEAPMDEESFQTLQRDYMAMQYDDVFSKLEARDGDASLLLVRGEWISQMTGGDFALPQPGCVLPPEALIAATELRAIFGSVIKGISGGYRQVVLPFLTVTHMWTDAEHPDPEEELLKGVLDVLQARWEDFAERDVGLFLEAPPHAPPPPPDAPLPKRDSCLWLITCRTRQHLGHTSSSMTQLASPSGEVGGMVGAPSAEEMAAAYLAAREITEAHAQEMAGKAVVGADDESAVAGAVGRSRLSPPPEAPSWAPRPGSAHSGSEASHAGSEESA